MNESIVNSIKKMLGISYEDDSFDLDIITLINSFILGLVQMGILDETKFVTITSIEDTWDLLITDFKYNGLKTYLYLKTKLVFDPPSSNAVIDSINKTIQELEWRMVNYSENK